MRCCGWSIGNNPCGGGEVCVVVRQRRVSDEALDRAVNRELERLGLVWSEIDHRALVRRVYGEMMRGAPPVSWCTRRVYEARQRNPRTGAPLPEVIEAERQRAAVANNLCV